VRRLTRELEQMNRSEQPNPYHGGNDVNPIDTTFSSSHEDLDNKERGARRRSHLRDDLRDFKIEAP